MSVFNKDDVDILDAEVLRRLLKFANHTSEDLVNKNQEIQHLKRVTNENSSDISSIRRDVNTKEVPSNELREIKEEVRSMRKISIIITVVLVIQLLMFGMFFVFLLKPELLENVGILL